jgi:thiosulfate/3-mercaptopyruvate sulfurtransferase
MLLKCSCLCVLLLAFPDETNVTAYPRPELLIEAPDLDKLLKEKASPDRPVVLLDARTSDEYRAGHIPGSRSVNHAAWSKAFAKHQDAKTWGQYFDHLHIRPNTHVIVYDDSSSLAAARIWWILRYWGVKKAQILNGGWSAWNAMGGEVTQKPREEKATESVKFTPVAERLATKGQVLESLKEKTLQIVDVRSEGEFCGEVKNTNKRGGAIPGAIHLEWKDLIDQKTQKFKSPQELAKLFKDAGIDLKRPTVTYCQSGGRAAVMAFGLELMGAKNVRNYYRSWSEWGNDKDTPIVKPPKK